MVELSRNEIVGWDTVGVREPEVLRFGQVSLRLELPALRAVICGGIEVVQAVLMAVRDRNWGTVPGLVSLLERDASEIGRASCRERV